MNFQTRGHSRVKLKTSVVRQIYALRKSGYTCSQIAQMTGAGRSTVARYTTGMKIEPVQPVQPVQPVKQTAKKKAAKKPVQKPVTNGLSPEAIDYIHKIYQSRNYESGTFIGNLFIRIGKMFGGHNPV
jgi:hypothetical protein